jgi:hypothetical protein
MLNFFKRVTFLRKLRGITTIGMIVILASSFSCAACDENTYETGRKVIKAGGVLGGWVAAQIDPAMLFVYGAANATPRQLSLSMPITSVVMAVSGLTHISRLTTCASIIQDSIEKSNNLLVSTAQAAHSILNGVFPIVYIGMRTEREFPLFAAIVLPFRASSELIKRMEFDNCLAKRELGSTQPDFQHPIISIILNATLSIPKALMIKSMTSNTLSAIGYEDEDSNFLLSTSLAVASSALTTAFESDKITILSKRLMQDPAYILLRMTQATLVSSIYYGMGSGELELPILAAASVVALEAVVEAVSIDRQWTTRLTPWGNNFRSKIASWLGL